jgi:UDP-N-acetyl-D-galactosamine dehydrogenase
VPCEAIVHSAIRFTDDPNDLAGTTVFVITVPTPVDADRRPDLSAVTRACELIAPALSRGAVVVLESTVYPGVTEEICGTWLAKGSGLEAGADFKLGYSPERINPGDTAHGLEHVVKVVAGQDEETLERLAAIYGSVTKAGVHRAPSIKVAEAAKVIENTQRDLNIALMNELAIIFERLGIETRDVLAAAGTKWNFLPFTPGLVGGHCIGVDPYYLTARAEAAGYHPEVILAGRRINDGMGSFIARRLVKMLLRVGRLTPDARIGILGLSFKENVRDIRNSRVPAIVSELREFNVEPMVHDPLVDPDAARHEYDIELVPDQSVTNLDAMILAVPHRAFVERPQNELMGRVNPNGIVIDVKSILDPRRLPAGVTYWSL